MDGQPRVTYETEWQSDEEFDQLTYVTCMESGVCDESGVGDENKICANFFYWCFFFNLRKK